MNEAFFQLLSSDSEFCETLGRMMLAASELESSLRAFLIAQGHEVPESRATLGSLSTKLAEVGLLSENGQAILELTGTQRNHFAHKLYDLLTDRAESALLPRESLEDADVGTFTDYAWTLTENLNGLTATVKHRIGGADEADTSSVLL